MTTIVLPEAYKYVGASLLSTVFLLLGQGMFVVGKYRKRAGIEYPQIYADSQQVKESKDAHLFNCAQRAHQNTLEMIPIVYTTTIITGLKYPVFAAITCATWTLARISYTRGYVSGDPAKRVSVFYRLNAFALIGSLLASTYIVGEWVTSELVKLF